MGVPNDGITVVLLSKAATQGDRMHGGRRAQHGPMMDRWPDVRRQSSRRAVSDPRSWRMLHPVFHPFPSNSGYAARAAPPALGWTRRRPRGGTRKRASRSSRSAFATLAAEVARQPGPEPAHRWRATGTLSVRELEPRPEEGEEDRLVEEVVDEAVAAEETQEPTAPRKGARPAPDPRIRTLPRPCRPSRRPRSRTRRVQRGPAQLGPEFAAGERTGGLVVPALRPVRAA